MTPAIPLPAKFDLEPGYDSIGNEIERKRSQRALARILEVNDIGAVLKRDLGLFGPGHAREH